MYEDDSMEYHFWFKNCYYNIIYNHNYFTNYIGNVFWNGWNW